MSDEATAATVDALRGEVAALTKERDAAIAEAKKEAEEKASWQSRYAMMAAQASAEHAEAKRHQDDLIAELEAFVLQKEWLQARIRELEGGAPAPTKIPAGANVAD